MSVFTGRGFFCNQPNVEIFFNCKGVVTSEGTNWAIKKIGVHLMFPPDAVSEPTPIMVQRWKYSACSPPLEEHEAITSNVIELSSMDSQGVKFNTKVKLSLSHSATNLRGYELVIKQLTDKETNKWEEVDGTKDIRSLEGIKTSPYTVEQRVADYQLTFYMKTFRNAGCNLRISYAPIPCRFRGLNLSVFQV